MNITVIGAGYVGLTTALSLVEHGHEVVCVDENPIKIAEINAEKIPFYETGLTDLLKKYLNKTFTVTISPQIAILNSEMTIIAVGTPTIHGEIDLTQITHCAKTIGEALRDSQSYHLILVKSTVLPGTCDEIITPLISEISGKKSGVDFSVCMNPEFLREGTALEDALHPSRIVFACHDERTYEVIMKLYANFKNVDFVKTNNKTAELIKYTNNAFLATLISFSNEIANLCSIYSDVDAQDVLNALHLDPRLNPRLPNQERIWPEIINYLKAGCGYGGSCLPKDVKALLNYSHQLKHAMPLLTAVEKINEEQPLKILDVLSKHFSQLHGIKIGILGLAFKPNTDDIRYSPALTIIEKLLEQEAIIYAHDPQAIPNAKKYFSHTPIFFHENFVDFLSEAKVLILLTSWEEYRRIPELIRKMEKIPLLIDGRRMIDKYEYPHYEGIGFTTR